MKALKLEQRDREALARLDELLRTKGEGGVALAWSGGVDSSFLEWRLKELGVRFARKRVNTPILEIPEVAANGRDRCYHCKRAIFASVRDFAQAQNLAVVMDGTNADDIGTNRPGLRALAEFSVFSPLMEARLGKMSIRRIAAAAELSFATMASSPCAATRFPYGEALTHEKIAHVEAAEDFLREIMPKDVDIRVRYEGGAARLEFSPEAIPVAEEHQRAIASYFSQSGFTAVKIDPAGYRTSD